MSEQQPTPHTRYQQATKVIDRLTARESHYMTPNDWRTLDHALNERADAYFALKRAGLHYDLAEQPFPRQQVTA